jgi:hypothetical protein
MFEPPSREAILRLRAWLATAALPAPPLAGLLERLLLVIMTASESRGR